ncbi:Fe-S oxidoreductase [Acidovorax bellezanensis]|uniref:Fe-S oxidoreductase n=1 Tax=Acidovorax bellezanensis TaxID=2976702 RepID=UPI0021C0EC5A|nr:Fe-S oxidoreductase [Acidovorax sp. Be4]
MNLPLPPAGGPSTVSPVLPAAAAAPVAAAPAVVPALPVTPALSLSAQAQQALRLQVFQTLIAQLVTQVQSGPQAAAPQWPTAGVAPALRAMLAALLEQATASLPRPQQLVSVQAWPKALLNVLLTNPATAAAPLAGTGTGAAAVGAEAAPRPILPPLQNWLVQQGVVQTPQGERSFSLSLQVPQAWAQLQAATALPAAPFTPGAGAGLARLQLPFAASPQQLESGTLALVMQGTGPAGEKLLTSALLRLDFQPLPSAVQSAQTAWTGLLPGGAAVAQAAQAAQQGQAALQAKNDPWLQMAALQASGQQPREDQRLPERRTGLCTQLGCPYRGKASCAQPFCAEMNRVWASVRIGPTGT